MMTNTRPQKHKAPQFLFTILFIFSILAGMLSSCSMVTNGADFTLTPMVENPATEELTLVPETEVVTLMPTITLTPKPTKTEIPSPTLTKTEIPEKYPIDLEKLRNFPKSYEYLVAHPEEFVEAPDGVADPQALLDWYYHKFVPTVGDQTKLEPSLTISSKITNENVIALAILEKELQAVKIDKMMFAYFVHNDKKYAIPIFTLVDYRGYDYETYALITDPNSDVLEDFNSDKIIYIVGVLTKFVGTAGVFSDDFVDEMEMMINGGINGSKSDTYFRIGVGFFKFVK